MSVLTPAPTRPSALMSARNVEVQAGEKKNVWPPMSVPVTSIAGRPSGAPVAIGSCATAG
jgi:hypothetical protein